MRKGLVLNSGAATVLYHLVTVDLLNTSSVPVTVCAYNLYPPLHHLLLQVDAKQKALPLRSPFGPPLAEMPFLELEALLCCDYLEKYQ